MAPIVSATVATIVASMAVPMTADTTWLTYAELAERLGITGESARNLVRRRRWPRKPGNDGTQRIGIPAEYLDGREQEAEASPPVDPPIIPPAVPPAVVADEATMVAAFEAHIATLKRALEAAEAMVGAERSRADAERLRADGLAERLDRLREDADKRIATLADEGRAALDRQIAELRALFESTRKRAWWRRLAG